MINFLHANTKIAKRDKIAAQDLEGIFDVAALTSRTTNLAKHMAYRHHCPPRDIFTNLKQQAFRASQERRRWKRLKHNNPSQIEERYEPINKRREQDERLFQSSQQSGLLNDDTATPTKRRRPHLNRRSRRPSADTNCP